MIGMKADVCSAAYGRSGGEFNWRRKRCGKKTTTRKMSEPESTADETKKLSKDARGLGPNQAGLIRIGVVEMIVTEGGWRRQDSWPRKTKSSNRCGTGRVKFSTLEATTV